MAIVPTKNPMALIGYYLGVASLIPGIGCATAPFAVILGLLGILKANANLEVAGMGHGIAAIALGIGGPLLWVIVWFVLAGIGPGF